MSQSGFVAKFERRTPSSGARPCWSSAPFARGPFSAPIMPPSPRTARDTKTNGRAPRACLRA
eukprot:7819916-Lingulodinium_polyedra.AAC.1